MVILARPTISDGTTPKDKQRCSNCYYHRQAGKIFKCHRLAYPVHKENGLDAMFLDIWSTDWCGEWKQDV